MDELYNQEILQFKFLDKNILFSEKTKYQITFFFILSWKNLFMIVEGIVYHCILLIIGNIHSTLKMQMLKLNIF